MGNRTSSVGSQNLQPVEVEEERTNRFAAKRMQGLSWQTRSEAATGSLGLWTVEGHIDKAKLLFLGEVDDLVTKMMAISGTSLLFAFSIMAWLNSYLSKVIPHRDQMTANEGNDVIFDQQLPQSVIIPYGTLELVFIGLASSGVAVLLGVTFIAYHLSRNIRRLKRMMTGVKKEVSTKKFRRFQSRSIVIDIFMGIGVFAGFLSVAFSILLFHSNPFWPFLCFLLPLSVFIIVTMITLLVLFR